jgi:hypothetical protein
MPTPTRGQIGESGLHLATRPLLPQHDGTALILANDVERTHAPTSGGRGYRRRRRLRLQRAAFRQAHEKVQLCAFDVLALDGDDYLDALPRLRPLPD